MNGHRMHTPFEEAGNIKCIIVCIVHMLYRQCVQR